MKHLAVTCVCTHDRVLSFPAEESLLPSSSQLRIIALLARESRVATFVDYYLTGAEYQLFSGAIAVRTTFLLYSVLRLQKTLRIIVIK